MGSHSFGASFLLLASFLFSDHFFSSPLGQPLSTPPPPPPVCRGCAPPPPLPPPVINPRLKAALAVILDLKRIIRKDPIRNDPKNITSHWRGPNPCTYKGFRCSPNPSYKSQLTLSDVQFNGFDLRAPLAGFIDRLVDVSIFHANSNRFHGTIPSAIGTSTIPFLFELDLSNNRFVGPFPTQVLQATNLTFLDLRFNRFSGTVPPQIFSLDVDVLFINNNQFLQPLPSDLGHSPALYLTFANNQFTGPIPGSIGRASNTLLEVLFLNNRLSGCLPWEIGLLRLARVFDVSKNRLRGPIPMSFACLENIQILNLASNNLDGVVPEAVCELPGLRYLMLQDNYLTEAGPKCRKLIAMKKIDLRLNCITGLDGQRPPADCARFFSREHKGRRRCPNPSLHLPCKAARHLHGGSNRRQTAEEGPVPFATYDALSPV